uniref:Uncharacterized protein n=1 Tax=Brassica oleracea TaxID=3712 RepID=A0A3P6DWL5_BRAOL|nr:unnamed protein product [Brassica oleracea]
MFRTQWWRIHTYLKHMTRRHHRTWFGKSWTQPPLMRPPSMTLTA